MAKPNIKPTSLAKKPRRKRRPSRDTRDRREYEREEERDEHFDHEQDYQPEGRLQRTRDRVNPDGTEHHPVIDWSKKEGYHIHIKSLFTTKTFWAGVSLFIMSVLGILSTAFTNYITNPYIYPIIGVAFSICFVILRMSTNNPVTPSINVPDPSSWFKKK